MNYQKKNFGAKTGKANQIHQKNSRTVQKSNNNYFDKSNIDEES